MAENAEIQKVGERAFERLFKAFGWKPHGPWNTTFECACKTRHACQTHPTDIVAFYEDQRIGKNRHLIFDIKSYAAQSFNPQGVSRHVESLLKAAECAELSEQWKQRYLITRENLKIDVLLFLFNHDHRLDDTSEEKIRAIDILHESKADAYILHPSRINLLESIANDLQRLHTRGRVDSPWRFKIIDRELERPSMTSTTALPIENMLSDLIIVEGLPRVPEGTKADEKGYFIYYTGNGSTSEEWIYLMLYCYRYGLIGTQTPIEFRMPRPSPHAPSALNAAKQTLSNDHHAKGYFEQRLALITFDNLPTEITSSFSTSIISFDAR